MVGCGVMYTQGLFVGCGALKILMVPLYGLVYPKNPYQPKSTTLWGTKNINSSSVRKENTKRRNRRLKIEKVTWYQLWRNGPWGLYGTEYSRVVRHHSISTIIINGIVRPHTRSKKGFTLIELLVSRYYSDSWSGLIFLTISAGSWACQRGQKKEKKRRSPQLKSACAALLSRSQNPPSGECGIGKLKYISRMWCQRNDAVAMIFVAWTSAAVGRGDVEYSIYDKVPRE